MFRQTLRRLSASPDVLSQRRLSAVSNEFLQFREEGRKGVITLNRPRALNSLNQSMVEDMYLMLKDWQDRLSFVIVEAEGGKAFCAGGDIRSITSGPIGTTQQAAFFRQEYILNNLIGTFKIPYLALIDGITMGGGVGISVHGSFRVATEHTVFAMPETSIGLFPDVGGSFFLPRLPGQLGTFLALTGHRLKGADCLHAGIATHLCRREELPSLKQELLGLPDSSSRGDIELLLTRYSRNFGPEPFSLAAKLHLIRDAFSHDRVEDILAHIKTQSESDPQSEEGQWTANLLQTMAKLSPTSLKMTLKQMREGAKHPTLQDCLRMEYRMVRRFCTDSDFYEGVRALLVDKDQNPKWKPDSLDKVTDEVISRYFSPLPADEELPLH